MTTHDPGGIRMTHLDQETGRQILHELLRAAHRGGITCPCGDVALSGDIAEGLDGALRRNGTPVNLLVRVSLGMLRREQWLMFPTEPTGAQTCRLTGSGLAMFRRWEADHPGPYDPQLLGRVVIPHSATYFSDGMDLTALNDCFHDETDTP